MFILDREGSCYFRGLNGSFVSCIASRIDRFVVPAGILPRRQVSIDRFCCSSLRHEQQLAAAEISDVQFCWSDFPSELSVPLLMVAVMYDQAVVLLETGC